MAKKATAEVEAKFQLLSITKLGVLDNFVPRILEELAHEVVTALSQI